MKKLFTTLCSLLLVTSSYAQIMLKLDYNQELELVTAYVVPEKTIDYPNEIVGSIQVTFSVPRESQFSLGTIFSEIPNINWMTNNVLDNINFSKDKVYYSLGVEPIGKSLKLIENKEVKLFSFAYSGKTNISLLDINDPVIKLVETGLSIDIKNNISIASTLGVRNAYSGNLGITNLKTGEEDYSLPRIKTVYPNPGEGKITVEWSGFDTSNSQDLLELQFIDPATGRKSLVFELENKSFSNSKIVDVSPLISGNYIIKVVGENTAVSDGFLFNKKN